MALSPPAVQAVAADVAAARRDRRPIFPVRGRFAPGDIRAAYAVQALVLGSEEQAVGRKLALTSPASQAQMGVGEPVVGTLLAAMAAPEGAAVSMASFIAPYIEGEVAFRIGTDIEAPTDASGLVAYIDGIAAAFEIVDSAIIGWDVQILDFIADNACCAGFKTGPWQPFRPGAALLEARMSLARDGLIRSAGSGDAYPGGPLAALAWLAAKAVAMERPLRAGEIVLAGALGPMVTLEPGEWTLRVDGFAPLRMRVANYTEARKEGA